MKSEAASFIRRFNVFRIVEHHLNALVFALLVVTGLSQRFHDISVSQWVVTTFGGIDTVRLTHRYTGIVFSLLCIGHIAVALFGVIMKRWPATMMVTMNDFRDAIVNLRYYFGIADHPARCDRYDYKQKFEYWGVIAGGMLMIATGLLLWFPALVVTVLPGEFIPAAKALHSNEALLAFLVIVIWHIYNAVFSPEVFPLDTAIFTGQISRERMLHEHPLELARIEGVGVDELLAQGHADPGVKKKDPAAGAGPR